jgi:hypothetical protein
MKPHLPTELRYGATTSGLCRTVMRHAACSAGVELSNIDIVTRMATNRRTRERRPYGSLPPEDAAKLYSILNKDAVELFDRRAAGVGVSRAVFLEALALHLRDVTDADVASWMDAWREQEEKKQHGRQGALNIPAA